MYFPKEIWREIKNFLLSDIYWRNKLSKIMINYITNSPTPTLIDYTWNPSTKIFKKYYKQNTKFYKSCVGYYTEITLSYSDDLPYEFSTSNYSIYSTGF